MRLRVTRPITSHGRYYEAGEVVEMDAGQAHSFMRLYGWEQVDDPFTDPAPGPISTDGPEYADWYKSDLQAEAESRGLDFDGLKKAEIVALLEADDE